MTRSIDFALYHVASWKDGQFPKAKLGNMIVHYDTTSRAYDVQPKDMDQFREWVADNWETDNCPRGIWNDDTETMEDEPVDDYLDRLGVTIREA